MTTVSAQDLGASLEDFLIRLLSLAETDGIDTLVEMDVSFSQARIVFHLACARQAVPIHEIADALKLSVATAGRNIDRLVKLGLVERRESLEDRRVKLVSLTSAGDAVAQQQFASKRNAVMAFTQRLDAHDRTCLFEALAPILAGPCLRATSQEIAV